jgi:hypothetical protein
MVSPPYHIAFAFTSKTSAEGSGQAPHPRRYFSSSGTTLRTIFIKGENLLFQIKDLGKLVKTDLSPSTTVAAHFYGSRRFHF